MLTRIGALLIGLVLILQPMVGIPVAQAARSVPDTVPAFAGPFDRLIQLFEKRYPDGMHPTVASQGLMPEVVPDRGLKSNAASVVQMAAGGGHICVVTSGGGVRCWGQNGSGQLGDGTCTDRYAPADVAGLADRAIAVSAGGEHTCAITYAGEVQCWGNNLNGQLGNGTYLNNSWRPVFVAGTLGRASEGIHRFRSYVCGYRNGRGEVLGSQQLWSGG